MTFEKFYDILSREDRLKTGRNSQMSAVRSCSIVTIVNVTAVGFLRNSTDLLSREERLATGRNSQMSALWSCSIVNIAEV